MLTVVTPFFIQFLSTMIATFKVEAFPRTLHREGTFESVGGEGIWCTWCTLWAHPPINMMRVRIDMRKFTVISFAFCCKFNKKTKSCCFTVLGMMEVLPRRWFSSACKLYYTVFQLWRSFSLHVGALKIGSPIGVIVVCFVDRFSPHVRVIEEVCVVVRTYSEVSFCVVSLDYMVRTTLEGTLMFFLFTLTCHGTPCLCVLWIGWGCRHIFQWPKWIFHWTKKLCNKTW